MVKISIIVSLAKSYIGHHCILCSKLSPRILHVQLLGENYLFVYIILLVVLMQTYCPIQAFGQTVCLDWNNTLSSRNKNINDNFFYLKETDSWTNYSLASGLGKHTVILLLELLCSKVRTGVGFAIFQDRTNSCLCLLLGSFIFFIFTVYIHSLISQKIV